MHHDFWNFYTGDEEFKTTFFLKFKSQATEKLFQQHLISSSVYSMRLILLVLSMFTFYLDGLGRYFEHLWILLLT